MAPFYEPENSVRTALSKGHLPLDLEKWEKSEKSLIIVDSLKKYAGNVSPDYDYNYNKNLVSMLRRRENPVYQRYLIKAPFLLNISSTNW
jgi:hypothetical protein